MKKKLVRTIRLSSFYNSSSIWKGICRVFDLYRIITYSSFSYQIMQLLLKLHFMCLCIVATHFHQCVPNFFDWLCIFYVIFTIHNWIKNVKIFG
jgi:hypothetical protein